MISRAAFPVAHGARIDRISIVVNSRILPSLPRMALPQYVPRSRRKHSAALVVLLVELSQDWLAARDTDSPAGQLLQCDAHTLMGGVLAAGPPGLGDDAERVVLLDRP
jgi:hypothetical protein